MFQALHTKFKTIKHHLLTISFIGGFFVDNLTLGRVDRVFDNSVLAGYVLLAMLALVYLYLGLSGKLSDKIQIHAAEWAPLAVQFSFGGLMSGLLVFYSRSGSWYSSWPFLLAMVAVICGNEFIKKRAQKLVFNLSILFVGVFSYAVLIVPVILGDMGDGIFLASGFGALIVMALFIRILYSVVPNFMALNTRMIFFSIGIIYVTLNTLYFTNMIPPIPLSMKEIGIYHAVEKLPEIGGYRLTYEKGSWYELWHRSDTTYHYSTGDRVFCYASVFAPTRLTVTINHHWEYYDEVKGAWTDYARMSYTIDGGRGQGYRGFSYIENVREGEWRCSVETARGQVIGRETFTIETGIPREPLVTRVSL